MRLPRISFVVASAILLAMLVSLGGCRRETDPWEQVSGGPPRVLVTFAPLYCFVKNVAGPDAAVMTLDRVGPHDFKPDAFDRLKARRADLFLASGQTLDDFVTNIANDSLNPNTDFVHRVSDAITKEQLIPFGQSDHVHPNGEPCADGEFDPHVWLGIDEAVIMVNRICKLLQDKNPAKKEAYQERADQYVAQLRELKEEGRKLFAGKVNKKFLANHDSFRYFARCFGLEFVDSIQVQPGVTMDSTQLNKLITLCKQQQIRVIGVEPQYSTSGAEKLRSELAPHKMDIAIITLDPLETANAEELDENFYIQGMRRNLQTLAEYLK